MWWFYMTWLPKFLHDRHGLDLLHIGLPLILIYVMADIGSIAGGWLSSSMIKQGVSVNRARKTAMLLCGIGVLPLVFAQSVIGDVDRRGDSRYRHRVAPRLQHEPLYARDRHVPETCGGIRRGDWRDLWLLRRLAIPILVGYLVVGTRPNYFVPFLCVSLAYLIALGVIHLFAPRLTPAIVGD